MVDLMLQNSSFAIKIMISQHFKDGIQRQYEEVPYTIIYPIQEESSFFFSEQSGDDYYFQISIYPAFGQTTIGRALITCSQINLASKNSIINAFGSFLMISPILSAKLMQPTGEVKLNFSLISPCIEAVDTRMVDIYKVSNALFQTKSTPKLKKNQSVGDTCKKYQIVHVNFKKQNGEVEYANNDGTAGAKLDQVLNNTNQRIAFEITWTSFANANNSCAALNAAIDRLLVDASSMRADVIFLSSVPSVCEALALKQPNYSVFFISMWNQEKDSPMQLEIQRSLKEAVRFCKTNHLEGLVCSGKSLVRLIFSCGTFI
jgi:hypothetical protein